MKLSVSLPDEDVAVPDDVARTAGPPSRSAALHHAVGMLRLPALESDDEAAWNEWAASGDHAAWSPRPLPTGWTMQRGEIRLVDLDPARGSEANEQRPAVVVSNDRASATAKRLGRGVVTVVPVASNTDRVFPFQALLGAAATGVREDLRTQAEQVRSVAVERVGALLGRVPAHVMTHLDDALRLHLQL